MAKLCTQYIFKLCFNLSKPKYVIIPVLMLVFNASLYAQNAVGKITGTIKDSKGEPLFGVSILVKGTSLGAASDENGKFTINVPNEQSVLVFSYIGFGKKEIVVGKQKVLNVTLTDNSSSLSEVVVTGYGQAVKKSDLVGSIGSVSAKQIGERQPVSLLDALEGQVAGALVTTDGGDPLSQGSIQIRGASTINGGNGPLYVIDGVLNNDATFLNPQDIASVEVLKDAASASIYGVRGANGVIIITTKRGKEGKPSVVANYYHLFGKLAHKLHTVSSDDLRYYRKTRGDSNNGINQDSVNHYLNADNDYQDLLFRTGNRDNVNVSFSGGQKGLNYYASGNYVNDRSIVVNSYAEAITSMLNVDYQATDKFRIMDHISAAYQTGNSIDVGTTAKQVFERNPWTSIYKPDGTLAGYVESKRNPVAYALLASNNPATFIIQDNITASYQIFKDIKFSTSLNGRLDNITTQTFSPMSLTSGGTGLNTGGTEMEKKFTYELQTYFNYAKTFGKDHNVTALLGFSRDRYRDDDLTFAFNNYLSEAIRTSNDATIDLTKTNTTATYNATESLFARAQYSYKNRYIINGTFRRDGSSRFGPDNKWGNFGAGGFAWRFSDEKFMAWTKGLLYDAKLRYSYGVLGNDKVGDFAYATLLNFGAGTSSASNSGIYNGNGAAYISTTLGNSTIHWEQTSTHNIGMDLSMLEGRLTITPEYYIKTTNGLLYSKPLPEETGYKSGTINLGNIQNHGLEISVTGTPIAKKNFTWNVSANATVQSAGLIKQLSQHVPFYASNGVTPYYLQEGGHIGDFYLLKNLGVYQYDVSNAYDANWNMLTPVGVANNGTTASGYTLNGQPYTGTVHHLYRNGNLLKGGSTIWENTNKDSLIDDNDRQVLGNAIPKFFWGFNNFFTYKNFTFNILFNASFGNKIYNSVANGQNSNSSTYSPPTYAAIYNSWTKEGDIAAYPQFTQKDTYGGVANNINSLYLEDGSFIRLSSVKLTYNLSQRVASRIKARGFSIYIYGNNLATWTNYSWYDPEFTSSGALTPGMDNGKYPRRRELGLGLNLTL